MAIIDARGIARAFDGLARRRGVCRSLAVCAWAYLITWATPAAPAMGWRALAVNATAAGRLRTAPQPVRARRRQALALAASYRPALLRSLYVWIASVLLLAVIWLWQPVGGDIYRSGDGPRGSRAAVQLFGIWLIVQSVRAIDALELAGIRQALPAPPASHAPPALAIRGPYRSVRHPLYFGWVLVMFGAAHMTADRLAFAALTTAVPDCGGAVGGALAPARTFGEPNTPATGAGSLANGALPLLKGARSPRHF